MKILWIVNTIFPYPSEKLGFKKNVFGGWLLGLFKAITKDKNINIAIATVYSGKEFLVFEENNTKYYLLPCKNNEKYDKNLEHYWEKIVEDYNPDIVHIHGTEYPHGLSFQKACPSVKNVISIQGLISVYANNYISNIEYKNILRNITLRDIIKNDNIYQQQKKFRKRGQFEIEIIKKCTSIIGRTEWDYANTIAISGDDKYFKCNETLRDTFYNKKWDINKIEKHSIFISQANYPIKGFHMILEAANILKNKYDDLKIYVAGYNILDDSSIKSKLKRSGYAKYLTRLIRKYDLESVIHFTGLLTEEEMANKMCNCHVFVQASSIENSPNSLGEAMILGLPCVASNVGGTSTMIKDKEECFLYPYGDYGLLSYYVSQIFDNNDMALMFSKNAKKHAEETHDREKNVKTMIKIYKDIINKKK